MKREGMQKIICTFGQNSNLICLDDDKCVTLLIKIKYI